MIRIHLLAAFVCYSTIGCTQTAIRPEIYKEAAKVVCAIYNNVQSKATAKPIDSSGLRVEQSGESYIQVEQGNRLFLFSEGAKGVKVISEPGAVSVNICNYAEDSSAYVSIKRGCAVVVSGGFTWKLGAGQAIRIGDSVRSLKGEETKRDTAWINGRYYSAFSQSTPPLFNALGRMYGYSIVHVGKINHVDNWWVTPKDTIMELLSMCKTIRFIKDYKVIDKMVTIYYNEN